MTYRQPSWLEKAPEALRPMLEAMHKLTLGIEGGEQADFNGIDLTDVDKGILHIAALRGAKFIGATVFGVVQTQEPVVLQLAPWPVLILDSHVLLGCQEFAIAHLPDLDEQEIMSLDLQQADNGFAVQWWENNKATIIAEANAHVY